jgi:DNA-binding NtrC family response regulator
MSDTLTLLIVDDNPSLADAMVDVLELKGFAVRSATSGADALVILATQPVDILLTDVRMPDMNGVALYRSTRKAYPRLVTILMTAYAADDIIQQGMAEGIKTILTKPVDMNYLISLVSALGKMAKKTGAETSGSE